MDDEAVRPTRRTLDDLGLQPPTVDVELHRLDHPVVAEAQKLPQYYAAGTAERIRALPDRVWFKEKTGRHRAAVCQLGKVDRARLQDGDIILPPWWIGAAGRREDGSTRDFYEVLSAEAWRAGSKLHPTSDHLLPTVWDAKRLEVEHANQWVVETKRILLRLIARSLRCGQVVTAEYRNYEISALVRAENGNEAYLVIAANGVVDPKTFATILSAVPGVAPGDWQPEPGGVSGITPPAGHVVWSTLFPPEVTHAILEEAPEDD